MKITIKPTYLEIQKETGDKRANNESHLLYLLKLELNKMGYNLIKQLMWKDGHLVSDTQHYLRSRNNKDENWMCIHDSQYAVRNSAEDYNAGKVIRFEISK